MADESFIGVAPDASGKKVRNLALDVLQPDGTTVTVQMQIIAIADENGRPFNIGSPMNTSDNETSAHLARIVELLEMLVLQIGD